MKHTEGPWHVWNEQYLRVGPTHNCTVAGVFACPSGDQQANAQLIAAAPEMLATLKMVLQFGRIDDSESRMNQVASIIAKVENRECYRSA